MQKSKIKILSFVLGGIHLFSSLGLFFFLINQNNNFSAVESGAWLNSLAFWFYKIFSFPLVFLMDFSGSVAFSNEVVYYALYFLNSVLWGVALYFVVKTFWGEKVGSGLT